MYIPPESMPSRRREPLVSHPGKFPEKNWVPGDKIRYYSSEEAEPVVAGLYWPSGLEGGYYFGRDGKVYVVSGEHGARVKAKLDGVEFVTKNPYRYLP